MKVAVIVGGDSEERDISIASGGQIAKALRDAGVEAVILDTHLGLLTSEQERVIFESKILKLPPKLKQFSWKTFIRDFFQHEDHFKGIDLYFFALHGGSGENGTLQAFFDLMNMPYTGSGHLASACAMNKTLSKKIMVFHGIPTPDWYLASDPLATEKLHQLDFPLVVKPNEQGSTVGLTIAYEQAQLTQAIALAQQFDKEVIIEKFIPGRELTVSVLNHQALAVGEIVLPKGVEFDYSAKYQPGIVEEVFPALVDDKVAQKAKQYAHTLHQVLGLSGYSRTDFRLDEKGDLWCLEINSLPGMTEHSLLPQAALVSGISFPDLCLQICRLALDSKKGSSLEIKNVLRMHSFF